MGDPQLFFSSGEPEPEQQYKLVLVSVMLDQDYIKKPHEPLSTVYGLLITLHKMHCKDIKKTSLSAEDIIEDFKRFL